MADGTEYDLAVVNLPASSVATIDIKAFLTNAPAALSSHISEYGSAALRYNGTQSALLAQTAFGSTIISESYVSRFTSVGTGSPSAQRLEGLWWAHDSGIGGFVGLSNAADKPRTVTVQPIAASGQAQIGSSLTLAPHATQMIDLMSLMAEKANSGDAGGLRIQFDGQVGEVNVFGGLENRQEGYSAIIPFWQAPQAPMAEMDTSNSMVTIAHPGIMIGAADPIMGFPAGTRFKPYLAFRNLTGSAEQVNLTLYTAQGTAITASVQAVQPFESRNVDLSSILQQIGLKDFNGGSPWPLVIPAA